jgi:hypothetical protein
MMLANEIIRVQLDGLAKLLVTVLSKAFLLWFTLFSTSQGCSLKFDDFEKFLARVIELYSVRTHSNVHQGMAK